MGKTYCTCTECPFRDCDVHYSNIKAIKRHNSFAGFYKNCSRYIQYLMKEIMNE